MKRRNLLRYAASAALIGGALAVTGGLTYFGYQLYGNKIKIIADFNDANFNNKKLLGTNAEIRETEGNVDYRIATSTYANDSKNKALQFKMSRGSKVNVGAVSDVEDYTYLSYFLQVIGGVKVTPYINNVQIYPSNYYVPLNDGKFRSVTEYQIPEYKNKKIDLSIQLEGKESDNIVTIDNIVLSRIPNVHGFLENKDLPPEIRRI